ncbi:MAG: N(G),N(G)-dimethylarginine dimethylaminohydrolase [Streptosporangiales bacterium]|nr:N(G),N(G)-dimethylarginine dimethylaminohydrolase [Streptosporangiales bacterium]
MTNSARGVALVRPPAGSLADGIVTHIERQPVDVELAGRQHKEYVAALGGAGWSVREVEQAPACPDSVFVEDAVVVVGDVAVLTRPGAEERRGELAAVADVVAGLPLEVHRIEAPGTLDGGDVLQIGDTCYVGRGGRTNGAGIAQLRAIVAPLGRRVVPVPLGQVLHLKSAVTALPDDSVVGLADLVDQRLFPSWRDVEEPAGCHVVPLGDGALLMAASAPRSAAWFSDLGFDVVAVDISEFEKLEGCVTCLSVLVPSVSRS